MRWEMMVDPLHQQSQKWTWLSMVKQKHRRGVFNDMAALQATVNKMNKELKFEVRSET
jgi:hypothetical protein